MHPVPSFIEDQAFPGLAGVCRCREGTHTKTALWFQHGLQGHLGTHRPLNDNRARIKTLCWPHVVARESRRSYRWSTRMSLRG